MGRVVMAVILLSLASAMVFGFGIVRYCWMMRKSSGDGPTQAMLGWVVIFWAAIGLVPALCAAGLTVARFGELSWLTRLVGLVPAHVMLIPVLLVVGSLAWVTVADLIDPAQSVRDEPRRRD
jgi:hypothetical protein